MTALRWILGISTGAFGIGWGFPVIAGDDFRSSFGGSRNAWWKSAIPIVIAMLLLATILWPERQVMLDAVAVLVVGLLGLSLFLARETVFVACLGVFYCVSWLIFYYRSVWGDDSVFQTP